MNKTQDEVIIVNAENSMKIEHFHHRNGENKKMSLLIVTFFSYHVKLNTLIKNQQGTRQYDYFNIFTAIFKYRFEFFL